MRMLELSFVLGFTDIMILLVMVCFELHPQTDVGALYSQLKELQKKNADMEERNKILSSKVLVTSLPC